MSKFLRKVSDILHEQLFVKVPVCVNMAPDKDE